MAVIARCHHGREIGEGHIGDFKMARITAAPMAAEVARSLGS